ncbi:hypothetical protein F2P81_025932 [Scophthalmus maximus]|uniref:KN homeodomain domain-containing protein n=1 Tax=Scophthalmus maximus TaxID=52904 RepID=A0A6A4RNA9_SCOMX|nr:hypothetical protein F2P81_025932 [Scophthalmus maximus]
MARPLKQWLYKHRDNPYPTKTEKILLALGSQMTLVQHSHSGELLILLFFEMPRLAVVSVLLSFHCNVKLVFINMICGCVHQLEKSLVENYYGG